MSVSPILFKSGDSGATLLAGQSGKVVTVFNECLILKNLFTAISGASFVDNTAAALLETNATPFKLFQGPTVTVDEAYFGLTSKFDRLKLNFGTPGVGTPTIVWEYWNGSAWTTLTIGADGTSGLTANGTLTWTIPGNWTTTAVNGVTCFWIRVRFTTGSWSTNPLVKYATITGWIQAFVGTNKADYHMGGGNQFYMSVDDAGATANEARILGYETMSALGVGTGSFGVAGGTFLRKSATADATTRSWLLHADDRTMRIGVLTGDTAGHYFFHEFGDFKSVAAADGFRTANLGGGATGTNTTYGQTAALASSQAGHHIARSYTGTGGSITCGKHIDAAKGTASTLTGIMQYPNGPDGGRWLSPIWLHENAVSAVRGTLRGIYTPLHADTNFTDGDTLSGAGPYAGKTFLIVKAVRAATGAATAVALETSDTWDTN